MDENNQLARKIYHKMMSTMKYTLELEEMSYRDQGRNAPGYRTFKKHLMSNTYDAIRSLFAELESLGLMEKTDYEEDPKQGYQESVSGGSGYLNTKTFDTWLAKQAKAG